MADVRQEDLAQRFSQYSENLFLAAWQVYSDLAYKRVWKSVEIMPCDQLKRPFLLAREDDGCPEQVFVPVRAVDDISVEDMNDLLMTVGRDVVGKVEKAMLLAIVDSDSTIVYYALQSGVAVQDDRAARAVELSGDDKQPMSHRKVRARKRKYDMP